MALPGTLEYGTVKWHVVMAVPDTTADQDKDPDSAVPSGTVLFEPQIPLVVAATVENPVSILLKPTNATIVNGVLVDETGSPDVVLVSTHSAEILGSDWTYKVTIDLGSYKSVFHMHVPPGAIIDLSSVITVSASPGVVTIVDEATRVAAEIAAQDAAQSAEAAYQSAQVAVQAAEEATAGGGGGGGGAAGTSIDYVWDKSIPGYPVLPATAPAGVKVRVFWGPEQYSGPAWPGVLNAYQYSEGI